MRDGMKEKEVFVDYTPEIMLLMQWGKKGGGGRGTRNQHQPRTLTD